MLSSSRDDRFHLGEGLYLKNKITAEKRTKLFIMTSYFLSEFATITPRSQKNPIKGKSVFKIHHPPWITGFIPHMNKSYYPRLFGAV
jgi:hypothetical protein